jgi:hypothetical protein
MLLFIAFIACALVAPSTNQTLTSSPVPTPETVVTLYKDYCAHCHGLDGRPQTLVEIPMPETPNFSKPEWSEYEVDDLTGSISDGTGQMPAFKGMLSKQEMEALATLIIQLPKAQRGGLLYQHRQFRKADQQLKESMKAQRLTVEQ